MTLREGEENEMNLKDLNRSWKKEGKLKNKGPCKNIELKTKANEETWPDRRKEDRNNLRIYFSLLFVGSVTYK